MICPLKFYQASYYDPNFDPDCEKEKCGWWDEFWKGCAIKLIPRKLHELGVSIDAMGE